MKVPSRKRTARNPTKVPLWLRRLDRVKAELKATRFPRTAEEGFRQCIALSTTALRWLRGPSETIIPRQVKSSWRLKVGVCLRGCLLPNAGGWPSGGRSEYAISDDDLAIV